MRKDKVPVYSKNATSLAERPLRFISENAAQELLRDGKAKRVSARTAPLKIQLWGLERKEHTSPTTITQKEMQDFVEGKTYAVNKVTEYGSRRSWSDCVVYA